MKTSKRSSKSNMKQKWIVAGILTAVTVGVLILGWFSLPRNGAGDTAHSTVVTPSVEETPIETPNGIIDLGSGLKLEKLAFACGNFPEDGSDDFLPAILSATFVNEGEKTLQYAKVAVVADGKRYTFEFSTLPPGKSVCAFEMNRATPPDSIDSVSALVELISFFDTTPDVMKDKITITVEDGAISVKNISSENLEGELSIFFKNKLGSSYMGGITYRVRIGGLAAGQTVSGYSSHAYKDSSEIMFVQFVDANG